MYDDRMNSMRLDVFSIVYIVYTVMSTEKHDDVSGIFNGTGKSMHQNVILGQFLKIQLSPDISSPQSKKKYPNLPP